jgi:hypothetical protein
MVMDKPVFSGQKYHPSIQHLRRFKIHFNNKEDKQNGYYILMTSGIPVTTFGDGKYIVNNAQLEMLKDNHIRYNIDK